MNPIACAAFLAANPVTYELGSEAQGRCAFAQMQISGRGIAQGPDAAIPTLLEFNRMRVEGGLAFDAGSARVAVTEVRSAPDGGYLGISGEAWSPGCRSPRPASPCPGWGSRPLAG